MPKNNKPKSTINVCVTIPQQVNEFIVQLRDKMEKTSGVKIPYSQIVSLMLNIAIDTMIANQAERKEEIN